MKTAWHEIWGSARGPVRRLAPQTRIACGACAFAACLIAPASTPPGAAAAILCALVWAALCRPPRKVACGAFALGLAVFLPYFIFAPVARLEDPSRGWLGALSAPWGVFLRGMTGMQASIATVTALSASELRQGLVRLPVPGVVVAILLSIIQQAHTLLYETRGIGHAIAVRGGGAGLGSGLRILASLPRVWLPRIIHRAERVAAAMEVRGYCLRDAKALGTVSASPIDGIALALSLLTLAGVIALRLWGGLRCRT